MKEWFRKVLRDERGQTAAEYMLIIAVIVIAVVVIGKKVFVDQFFRPGVEAAGTTVRGWLECDASNPDCNRN